MSGNVLKGLLIVTGIALSVAVAGVAARKIMGQFDPGADLDAGADELDSDADKADFDVIFVNDEDDDADADEEADQDQPEE